MLPLSENEVAIPVPEAMTISEQIVGYVVVLNIGGRMAIEAESELSGLVRRRIAAGYQASC